MGDDDETMEILVQKHLRQVYNFAFRLTRDRETAEDIAQETFVKVWKNLKKYNPEKNFKTWLLAIAKNTALDYLRKKKTVSISDFDDFADRPFLAEDKNIFDNLLKKISPLYREIILLRYNDRLTFEEIGRILSRPLNTVKSQHRRALMHLKKILHTY